MKSTIEDRAPARTKSWIGLLLAIACLARLAVLAATDPQTGVHGGDSIWYLRQGWSIARSALEQPLSTVGPLYPLGLAIVWRLVPDAPFPAGDSLPPTVVLTLVRLTQVALSVLMVWLAYSLTRRLASDPRAALVAAAGLGLGPAFVMEPLNILTETVFMLCLTLGVCLHVRDQEKTSNLGPILTGLVFALATLTRPILLFFPVLLAAHLAMLQGRRLGVRRGAVMLAAFILTLLPWNLYLLYTTRSPLPSGFASNLWIGATGSGQWEGHEALDRRRRDFRAGDEDYLSEALGPIARNPLQWLRLRGLHLAGAVLQPHGTVNLTGPSIKQIAVRWWHEDGSFRGLAAIRHSPWFWLKLSIHLFHFTALAFSLVGAAVVLSRWRQYFALFAIIVYLLGVYGILTVTPRYLFPAQVFIWILAAVGLCRVWHPADQGGSGCESVS